MTTKKQMVMTLFIKEIQDRVLQQFNNEVSIIPVESFDMSFRLYKSKANNINLELGIQMTVEAGEEQDISGLGRGRIDKNIIFFKPIGFFTQPGGRQSILSNLTKKGLTN